MWLKELRSKKKLTQAETAKLLSVAGSTYTMIENGDRQKDLDLSLVVKLAEIFGVSMDYIAEQEKKIHEGEIK